LRVTNSTVSGNSAVNNPGGILNLSTSGNSRLEVTNSTIANNTGAVIGGIMTFAQDDPNATATTTLRNSIFATSSPYNLYAGAAAGAATIVSHGFNLASETGLGYLTQPSDKTNATAGLAALANNGGSTPTHALLGTSAALDAGNNSGSGTLTDQRGAGFLRSVDLSAANASGSDATDIGAYETQVALSPVPTAVVSRKLHNSVPYDINLPLTGNAGVECRSGGASNDYQVVFTFPSAVTFTGATMSSGAGSVGSSSGSGTTTAIVNLTGVTSAQTITITLNGVNNSGSVSVPMGVLVGDTNASRGVNASDIGQTKAASGQPVGPTNFRQDVNVSGGSINASDIGLVKARSGTQLP
jgi:hypothetical protein